jgi:hypothetical protein
LALEDFQGRIEYRREAYMKYGQRGKEILTMKDTQGQAPGTKKPPVSGGFFR